MWTDNPFIPYLDFRVLDENGVPWSLTWDEEKGQFSPSIAVNFTYNRKRTNLGGGMWSLSINDPTFAIMEILTDVFGYTQGGKFNTESGTSMGRVEFQYGYSHSKGSVLSGLIQGYITSIRPNIRHRSKIDLLFGGFDMSISDINHELPLTLKLFTGTLQEAFSKSITLMEAQPGADRYTVEFEDDILAGTDISDPKIESHGENAPHLAEYFVKDGNVRVSFQDYWRYLKDQMAGKGIHINIYFSGATVDGAKIIHVTRKRLSSNVVTFNVNSVQSESGEDNESRIINFDPSLTPITGALLGQTHLYSRNLDPDTLEPISTIVDVDNNSSLSVTEGVLSMPSIAAYGGNTIQSFTPESALKILKIKQSYLANMPITGTFKVKFTPYINLQVFDFVRLQVATPTGRLFFTSGVYLLDSINHSISNTDFNTIYAVVTSGTRGIRNTEIKAGEVNIDAPS